VTTTDIHALVGAYALDAVDDLERVSFERHVADCEACRAELDELRETVSRLADSTWSIPPPRLRTDVLAAVGRTRQLPPAESARPVADARAVSRWRRFTAGAAAAGILAAGVGAASWAVQEQRVQDADQAAEAAEVEQTRTQAILSAQDLVVKTATMTDGGRLTVASSASQAASVVSLRAAKSPGADRTFQMWTLRGTGDPVSAGVIGVGKQADARVVDGVPGNDGFAVTVEPGPDGSVKPSGEVVGQLDLI
jgi:anti-sigma-K factor RskA